MTEASAMSACPACAGAPRPAPTAAGMPEAGTITLSLPAIHCAGCIAGVERALTAEAGVRTARVNLTRRRVEVSAGPEVTAAHLIDVLTRAGYEAHELDAALIGAEGRDEAGRALLMRLAVAGFALMNVMLLSVAVWSGAEGPTRGLFHWISAAIALPAVAFAARPFFASALQALSGRRLNMDVPISLAILLATGLSLLETAQGGRDAWFDAALALTFFLLAGRWLDHRARAAARSAARELAALEVPRALRVGADGAAETVPARDLAPGDLVRVLPGAGVPADGVIETGESELDRSLLTGETLPAHAGPGTALAAGETNLTGTLTLRVTAAGEDSALGRMARLVGLAESRRNRYTALADRAARIYAPGVHLLALLAFAGWFAGTGDPRLAVNIAVAVLIITCPCALGLAVPAVSTAANGRLFRRGFLVKHETALERLAEVDMVVFDKTGTLTLGRPAAAGLAAHPPGRLALAYALAQHSAHPLARALAEALAARGIAAATLDGAEERPGQGVRALWQGHEVRLGRADWAGAAPGPDGAQPVTWLSVDGEAPVAFRFDETPRPGAAEAVAALRARGIAVALLSGDGAGAVQALAARLGIEDRRAGLTPEAKAAALARLSGAGRRVLMVGDGLNDTVALAEAHASLSPASALDAARVASDVVLLGESLAPLPDLLKTARTARARIVENFVLAAGYNAVAIPVALAGLASPLLAALAMSASSITVSLNAMRLR